MFIPRALLDVQSFRRIPARAFLPPCGLDSVFPERERRIRAGRVRGGHIRFRLAMQRRHCPQRLGISLFRRRLQVAHGFDLARAVLERQGQARKFRGAECGQDAGRRLGHAPPGGDVPFGIVCRIGQGGASGGKRAYRYGYDTHCATPVAEAANFHVFPRVNFWKVFQYRSL
jgi:hypothetical protein